MFNPLLWRKLHNFESMKVNLQISEHNQARNYNKNQYIRIHGRFCYIKHQPCYLPFNNKLSFVIYCIDKKTGHFFLNTQTSNKIETTWRF